MLVVAGIFLAAEQQTSSFRHSAATWVAQSAAHVATAAAATATAQVASATPLSQATPATAVAVKTPLSQSTPSVAARSSPTPWPTVTPTPTRVAPPSARPAGTVPVLMYHYIRVNPEPDDMIGYGLSVTPQDFAAQMEFLAERGYHTISLAQLDTPAADGKAIVITFDDGYSDAYTAAAPVLKRHGFTATFYIITHLVGAPRYLSWDQVRELAAAGHTIGSHTVGHPDLRNVGAAERKAQLVNSRAVLEKETKARVDDFCYPAGKYNEQVIEAVAAAGYKTAVTVEHGLHEQGGPPLEIPRLRVAGGMTLAAFAALLEEQEP